MGVVNAYLEPRKGAAIYRDSAWLRPDVHGPPCSTNQVYAKALRIGLSAMVQHGELTALTAPDTEEDNKKA